MFTSAQAPIYRFIVLNNIGLHGCKALSDPYCQSTCLSVCPSVCVTATLMLNISETKQFTGLCPVGLGTL